MVGAWESYLADVPRATAYLSFLDGEPVAAGLLRATTQPGIGALVASAALRRARGHGCYRAIVRARWELAVQLGYPQLVTQASPYSRPILERLGFEQFADLSMLRMTV